jgi:hypothetical protein
VQPHLDLGGETPQLVGVSAARQTWRDVGAEQACRIRRLDIRGTQAGQKKTAHAVVVQRVLRAEGARECLAPFATLVPLEGQQTASLEPHVVERREQMHRRREPGAARTCETGERVDRVRSVAQLRREPGPPVRDGFAHVRVTQQPLQIRRGDRVTRFFRQIQIGKNQRETSHAGIVSNG